MFNTEDFKKSVLDRAMRGKLTKHLSEDGDAKDLLNQIDAEKKALIENGKIKKQKPLPEIVDDEIPFEIPDNWQWVRLGEVAVLSSSSRIHKSDWRENGIPFYRAREIVKLSNNKPIVDPLFIDEKTYEEKIKKSGKPRVNDILFTGVGTLGTSWIVDDSKFYYKDASVLLLKNLFNLNAKYLNLFFKSPLFFSQVNSLSKGTAVKTLTITSSSNLIIPIPPLSEQQRIVKSIDKCFDLANHIDQEDSLTDKFNVDMRKSLLQSAMMGKLTKQLPEDGDASDLLDQIKSEKETLIKDKKIKAQKPLPEIDADEIPFDIPDNWRWVRLGEITSYIQRGKSPKYGDDGIKVLSQKCITWNGVDISKARKITKNSLEKYDDIRYLKPNDILWNSTGTGTLGRVSKVDSELINVEKSLVVDSHVTVIRVIHVVSKFILMYLLSPQIQGNLNKMSSGSTNQTELSKKAVENALIPLPPLSEQKRIVNKMDKLLDELKG